MRTARATSVMGSFVSTSSWRAIARRFVCTIEIGFVPSVSANKRRNCRDETLSSALTVSKDEPCADDSPSMRSARLTSDSLPSHSGEPGADSGRQRRQALKPASSAAAADATKVQWARRGVRAGQTGRQ
jgi:hypothetical protein